ncbi:PLP-dependent aminotransferase family protein [Paenibacillus sp. JX-17]|uniref:PLP-dependent aminotransferase family protein n=1 Tax=Paenibacillus lacisoli TaxID=3064525 RepID=A0ABT9CGW3_9BACL|nr:PLP-dependent aminotransferase family protein [Paenibacillus sp. JX-17]MDO7906853.1 PLP-dependent aminotransferase family protein [Paenibacillus sp. JX-17]
MFNNFRPREGETVYLQVHDFLKQMIRTAALQPHDKLPSTREMVGRLGVSRNTIIAAYNQLELEGLIYSIQGKGSFVQEAAGPSVAAWEMNWNSRINDYAGVAEEMDPLKHGVRPERGMIAFSSIAPDEKLFDLNNFKRAFLDRVSIEGEVVLNYGYAQGYQPLIDYLRGYMESKGTDMFGKDILITNGFTEGLDLLLSSFRKRSGRILCENPTHHSALRLFRMHGFEVRGVAMEPDGLDLEQLEAALAEQAYDLAYLIPSYHNPTGIVMSPDKRVEALRLFGRYGVPVVEDGFSEELRYSGAHVAPLIATGGAGNGVAYIGSFSKILFPGIRVGWLAADRELIDALESVKRARSIHTSTLDQSLLYQYLHNGYFDKYLKKARQVYKSRYEAAVHACREHIPFVRLSGDGGLHLFVELDPAVDTEILLDQCYEQGVVFTPGETFYTDGGGRHTMRLGFSRLTEEQIERGISVIGRTIRTWEPANE